MKNKYSKNKKLNEVLTRIEEDLMESSFELGYYMDAYPNDTDYRIVQYGNLLIYYEDIKKMYRDCGYKSLDKMSNQKVWEIYKRQVGYVARQLMK